MRKAALYFQGKVIVANSHLEAYNQLTQDEKYSECIVSGVFDTATREFEAYTDEEHFFDKEIILIRHAETLSKDPDPDLTEIGVRQAKKLARQLKEIDLTGCTTYCSPLKRCLQTAYCLWEYLKVPVVVNPDIVETPCFLKENEAFTVKNHKAEYPQFEWGYTADVTIEFESKEDFVHRVHSVLLNLPTRSILITHFGVICVIGQLALCDQKVKNLLANGPAPASITHINKDKILTLECNNEENSQNRSQASC